MDEGCGVQGEARLFAAEADLVEVLGEAEALAAPARLLVPDGVARERDRPNLVPPSVRGQPADEGGYFVHG